MPTLNCEPLIAPAFDDADVNRLRSHFPILQRDINRSTLIYFDNAASAQKPRQVVEAMVDCLTHDYANVHRGLHTLSNVATENYEAARETCRAFINAESTEEIIFTKNVTEAFNLLAYSWGSQHIGEDDEIILTIMEHHSNIVPWHFLREHKGAVIKWAPVSDRGELDLEEFQKLFTPRTKLVAMTHMSNVLGTLNPLAEICRMAHSCGVPVVADGAQSAMHMPIDVRELDVDFFGFTGHKVYGPSGIGVLYGKRALLEKMPPFLGGGAMIESVTQDTITYGPLPDRFEAGTPPIVEAVGLDAALDFMMAVGVEKIQQHEKRLLDYAQERMRELPGVSVYGTASKKGAIVSFNLDGIHPHDVATLVDRYGVAIRAGHHCASPLMERYNVDAMCRASFGVYNTLEEIDTFVDALINVKKMLA